MHNISNIEDNIMNVYISISLLRFDIDNTAISLSCFLIVFTANVYYHVLCVYNLFFYKYPYLKLMNTKGMKKILVVDL